MFSRPTPGWPARSPEVRWGLREAILCLVIAQVMAVFWAAGAHAIAPEILLDTKSIAFLLIGNIGLWLGYFFGPGFVSKNLGRGPRVDFDIGIGAGEAAVAVAAGVGLQILILPVLYWPIGKVFDADPGESARNLVDRVDGPLDVVLLAAAVVLIAPIVEERFFRGLLLPALTVSGGLFFGLVGTSILFALVHQSLIVLPGLTVFGLLVAWMTVTTGRIGPAIVTHMAFNATSVVQLLLGA